MQQMKLKTPDGNPRPFVHRGTPADMGVLKQIFEQRDYSLRPLRRGQELRELGLAMQRPLIVDAGANIGASVCWFAMRFPKSHVVAFEPEAANFALLRRNTQGFDVDLQQAAIGSRDSRAKVHDSGGGEWAFYTEPAEDGDVPLVAMSRIVAEKRDVGYEPFIAKIDIEGGERELFAGATEWIDEFPLLIVELHDWMIPGQATSRNFLQAVAARDRDFVQVGENTFSIRNG